MHAFVDHVVAIASAHALLAYALGVFLAAAEALPVIGAIVPGTAIIIAFGALIAAGALDFWPFVASVAIGAVLGDGVGYWLGHHYKDAALQRWPLSNHPEIAERGAALFRRHGGKSIFIARFTPGVRAVIPVLAGILAMSPARFLLANIVSAIAWALSHVLFGLLLGASLELLGAVTGRLAVLAALLFLLAYAVIWTARQAMRRLPQAFARLAEPIAAWAQRNPGVAQRLVARVLATDRAEALGLALTAALIVGGLWLLLAVVEGLAAAEPLARLDGVVLNALASLRSNWADGLMRVFAASGSRLALGLLVAGVALALAAQRQWLFVLAWLLGTGAALGLGVLLALLAPAVPTAGVELAGVPGNPEAMVAAAGYGLLGLFISRAVALRWRPAIASAVSLVVVFGAAGRLYLGLSPFSTELVAIAFALAWLGLVGFVTQLRRLPAASALPLALVALPVLIGAMTAEAAGQNLVAPPVPPPAPPAYELTLASWRDNGWATLPGNRVGLLGNYTQRFTFQWAGSLPGLSRALAAKGWRPPPSWSLGSTLAWLEPTINPAAIPVLPRFAYGRPEGLVLVLTESATARPPARLVLRLWPSNAVIAAGDHHLPLWLGIVVEERFVRVAATLTIARSARAPETAFSALANALPHAEEVGGKAASAPPDHTEAGPVLLGWADATSLTTP